MDHLKDVTVKKLMDFKCHIFQAKKCPVYLESTLDLRLGYAVVTFFLNISTKG